jgi:3-methyladenine DNA glycosylase AlkD
MEFLIDNSETEKIYRQIIRSIPSMQNGITAESMMQRGIIYEKNWGVSLVDLKDYSSKIEKDHLLALKLWNKKWRETMILATLLDVPGEVTDEQMDFWVKTAENTEIVEQMVTNLFTQTPYAFSKAMEWCWGKKFLVKYAGLLMMGRLSLTSENDIDEMFEIFFEVLTPLAKDPALNTIFYRSYCQLARRSHQVHEMCVDFAKSLLSLEEINAQNTGKEILQEINSEDFNSFIKN